MAAPGTRRAAGKAELRAGSVVPKRCHAHQGSDRCPAFQAPSVNLLKASSGNGRTRHTQSPDVGHPPLGTLL